MIPIKNIEVEKQRKYELSKYKDEVSNCLKGTHKKTTVYITIHKRKAASNSSYIKGASDIKIGNSTKSNKASFCIFNVIKESNFHLTDYRMSEDTFSFSFPIEK